MNQLLQLYRRLTAFQRATILVAVLVVAGGMVYLNRWNQSRDLQPLLTGLAPEDAAVITQKLKESGAEYSLADNGATILVHEPKLAEMRLQLEIGRAHV